MDALAIDAQHVARRFGRRWALVDVSFQLTPGKVMMLTGQNGSGKTTLLRVLATALRPDMGRASVAGFDVVRDRDRLRPKVAFLAHQSYLYDSLTARENLDVVARFCVRSGSSPSPGSSSHPLPACGERVFAEVGSGQLPLPACGERVRQAGVRGTVDELLQRVGLASRADDIVATFSAGMRKRLSFARVLLQDAEVVFLDEPYGELDPQGFSLVDEVIAELKSRGKSIVVATHQMERVRGYADEHVTLEAGRVAA